MTAVDPVASASEQPEAQQDFISDMQEHRQQGLAVPLSRIITEFIKYDERWWIADRSGWHVVDDQRLVAKLDNHQSWTEGGLYLGGRDRATTAPPARREATPKFDD